MLSLRSACLRCSSQPPSVRIIATRTELRTTMARRSPHASEASLSANPANDNHTADALSIDCAVGCWLSLWCFSFLRRFQRTQRRTIPTELAPVPESQPSSASRQIRPPPLSPSPKHASTPWLLPTMGSAFTASNASLPDAEVLIRVSLSAVRVYNLTKAPRLSKEVIKC